MSESEYVDRTPLDDPAWVIALVEERDALRARVAEMEGALRRVVQVADNTAGAFPDEVQEKDEYRRGQVRGAMDAARPARALLPAPAPGRDWEGRHVVRAAEWPTTEGSGTTDGGTDAA